MKTQIAYKQADVPAVLRLVFAEAGPGPTLELGPVAQIRIDGETLHGLPGNRLLALHHRHSWEVQGKNFFRLDVASPVSVHFEDRKGASSAVYGPFMHFSCADGIAYGDGAICANLDLQTKLWYSHLDRRQWRDLVVSSAAAPAG
jgi:hypothetical protein